MQMQLCKSKTRAGKGDENSMTFRLWKGKSIGLLPKSQPSKDLKDGPNIALKVSIEEEQWPLYVDLTYETSSLCASHRKVESTHLAFRRIVENARGLALA